MAKPQKTRASRAGLARGLDQRRLRRNAGTQALSRLVLGEGVELDDRSRLTATSATSSTESVEPDVSHADFADVDRLTDSTSGTASPVEVEAVADLADPGTLSTAAQTLRTDINDNLLPSLRNDLATLTEKLNALLERLNGSI